MDADRNVIPIVEDDQGEGFKDILDQHDFEKIDWLEKKIKSLNERAIREEHSRRFKK